MDLAEKGRIDAFLGMPCQSFIHARIPALRNAEFPEGKPGLTTSQQDLVDMGNRLAALTLAFIMILHAAHKYFTVENPCVLAVVVTRVDKVQAAHWSYHNFASAKMLRVDHTQRHILPTQQPTLAWNGNVRRRMPTLKRRSSWSMQL